MSRRVDARVNLRITEKAGLFPTLVSLFVLLVLTMKRMGSLQA